MRARWAVPAALAVVLACAPARAELRSRTRDLGAVSPVVSLLALEQGGSQDWGAGIPTPTIDCAATGTSSSASLQCSGASPTFAGSAQVAAGSPWWYRNDTAVRPSIALNGSTDWWGLGDVANPVGSLVIFGSIRTGSTVSGIVTKDNGSARSWGVTADASGNLSLTVFKSGGNSTKTFGTLPPGSWGSFAVAYQWAADGTSIIRGNVNGVASTDLTTAVGPILDTAAPLQIGYDFAARYLAGSVRRVAIWTGADAPTSAAQLAQLVATQWGLAADRPSGTVATHARTDSTLCCPFSDAECFWLGPGAPCIHAPTYQGWASGGAVAGGIEVYGTTSNLALNSTSLEAASWLKTAGAVAANASASCPRAPDGSAAMHLITAAGTGDGVYDSLVGGNGVAQTFSAWVALATGDSACPITMLDSWGGTATVTRTLSETPQRISVGQTGARDEFGVFFLRGSGGCARWCVWGPQVTKTATVQPYRSTPGASSYTGTASTATTLTGVSSLLNKDRFALGISATATGNWSTVNTGLLQWGGSYGSDNTVSVYTDASAKIAVEVYDGAAGWRRWTADAALSGTGQKRIGVAFNSGAIRVLVDDVEVSGTMSGAGTGLLGALPSTSLVVGTSGSSILRGLDARVCQANDVPGLKRCLR